MDMRRLTVALAIGITTIAVLATCIGMDARTPPKEVPDPKEVPESAVDPMPAPEDPPATAGPPVARNGHRPPDTAPPPETAAPGDRGPPLDEPVIPTGGRIARPETRAPVEPPDETAERAAGGAYELVDRAIDELEYGNVAFNAPDTMNLEETQIIHLAVGMSKSIEELQQRIEAEGELLGERIQLSSRMEARLTGPNFGITAITPEVQAVGSSSVTDWKWEVTPKSKGSHRLHLTLTALIDVEGRQTQKAIRTFDHNIDIYVTWQQQAGSFFRSYWQWIWAAVLLPLVGWAVKKWREKRAARKK